MELVIKKYLNDIIVNYLSRKIYIEPINVSEFPRKNI